MKYKLVFHGGEAERILEYGVKDEITIARTNSGYYRQIPGYLREDGKAKIERLIICDEGLVWEDASDQVKYIGVVRDEPDTVEYSVCAKI